MAISSMSQSFLPLQDPPTGDIVFSLIPQVASYPTRTKYPNIRQSGIYFIYRNPQSNPFPPLLFLVSCR